MAADRDSASRAAIGRSYTISASILTGLRVDSIAANASRVAAWAADSLSEESIADTNRSGTSQSVASSTAHSAARRAEREPSMPTTTL